MLNLLSLSQHINRRSAATLDDDAQAMSHKCLFITHLLLDIDGLSYSPNIMAFQEVLADTINRFQDCTLALPNLIPDGFFHAFTRYMYMHTCTCTYTCTLTCTSLFFVPITHSIPPTLLYRPLINRKMEDKTCGNGPDLRTIFEDDSVMIELSQSIQVPYMYMYMYMYTCSLLLPIGLCDSWL